MTKLIDTETNLRLGDMASHHGDIRIVHDLTKFCSTVEKAYIDKLFMKLSLGDRPGLERSLRNKVAASLRRRGVLKVERSS